MFGLGLSEIVVVLLALIVLALPVATLILAVLAYSKVNRLEQRLEQQKDEQ